jgi:hypothetical protein
MQLEVS